MAHATPPSTTVPPEAPPARLPLPTSILGRPIFYGWYIVALAFVAAMMSSGINAYSLGIFLKPMTEELGWSRTDISLGQTLSTGIMGILGLFIGGTLDRRGGRALMVIGAIASGVGFVLLGQVQTLWQYYVVKAGIITIGMAGMGAMVTNVAVSNWFVVRRGRAIAISAMGTSVAALILPSVAGWMIDSFGWRTAWAVIGVAIWVLLIPPAWIVMRRRPEDFGLEPDGGASVGRSAKRENVQQRARDQAVWTRRQAMRTPALWLLILTFGVGSMGFGAMLLHLIPYLTDTGFTRAEAAAGFSMIGLSGLLSKPLWGLLVERISSKYAAALMFLILGAGIALILAATSVAAMYASIFTLGIGVGGILTVQETVWADYFGRMTLGTVRSIGRPFTIVSSAGGPVFAGAAYDIGGSYGVAFLTFVATYVVAAGLILVTREPVPPALEATTWLPPVPSRPAMALTASLNGAGVSAPNGHSTSVPSSNGTSSDEAAGDGMSGSGVLGGGTTSNGGSKPRRRRRRDYMQEAPGGHDYMRARGE